LALVHVLRGSRAGGVRFGGLVDVVDALEHFRTVDRYELPPARYAAADLVVVNKLELVPEQRRTERFERIAARVAERNPRARLVAARRGGIDPQLLFDVAEEDDAPDELPIRALMAETAGQEHGHEHARAVTALADAPVDGARIAQLLESPPEGVYRIKGRVTVRSAPGLRRFVVNTAGGTVHIASERAARREGPEDSVLVAIGMELDEASVRERLEEALAPAPAGDPRPGVRRLDRLRRLSA
ncbi:MAG: GTP-binding protein, partial [Pseudoclavibacter sp.]|nr:GTP-binding protein [Pseudoclavibacter sp.]